MSHNCTSNDYCGPRFPFSSLLAEFDREGRITGQARSRDVDSILLNNSLIYSTERTIQSVNPCAQHVLDSCSVVTLLCLKVGCGEQNVSHQKAGCGARSM